MSEQANETSFEARLRALSEEQERIEQQQLGLRDDAEEELRRIDPAIESNASPMSALGSQPPGSASSRVRLPWMR